MFNHEPEEYKCPFCLLIQGGEGQNNSQSDIVYQDQHVTAFIAPRWWPRNIGHVLIVPNEHYENIYDLPACYGQRIHEAAREIALAFKAVYKCDGVSTRQHNEPAGGQDVWHYHLHVFPRYHNDDLYRTPAHPKFLNADERAKYAQSLRTYLQSRE
jgi:histidine triad (HIT) family protein